jgi:hypothetical protein
LKWYTWHNLKTLLPALLVAVQGIAYASDNKSEIGRYQLFYGVTELVKEHGVVVDKKIVCKIDTVTGQVWLYSDAASTFLPVNTVLSSQ